MHQSDKDQRSGSQAGPTPIMGYPGYPAFLERNEIDLLELWATLYRNKLPIFFVPLVVTIGTAAYSLYITPVYRAQTLLAPVTPVKAGSGAGSVSVISTIAGINIGAGSTTDEARAILRSRAFTEQFIRRKI